MVIDFGDSSSAIVFQPGESVVHTYKQSGEYTVTLWAANQCHLSIDSQVVVVDLEITGFESDNVEIFEVSIFPTIASDFFEIKGIYPHDKDIRLAVYNLNGARFFTANICNDARIDITGWPEGIYIVSLTGSTLQDFEKLIIAR
jgi:hypothetical protein